jgi:hypothetical protein
MRAKLTKITLAVSIVLAMAFTFSFSQEKTGNNDDLERKVNKLENSIDTLNSKFLSDNFISVKAAKETQELHNIAFGKIQFSFNIFVTFIAAIVAIAAVFNYKNTSDLKKELNKELARIKNSKIEIEKQKTELKSNNDRISELEKKLKEKIENALKSDKEKNQEKFDISFRFLSRIYRRTAEKYLDDNDFHEFFYYMYIFYRCLIKIELLDEYDLDRLKRTCGTFLDIGKKVREMNMLSKNKENIIWFIIHLLKFVKRCNEDNKHQYSDVASSMYNVLFNFSDFKYNDIRRDIEDFLKKDKDIQEILKLADNLYIANNEGKTMIHMGTST